MQTLALLAQKGGTGKTMLALSLAVAAARSGRKVLVLDIDPQGTACNWNDRRTSREQTGESAENNPLVLDAQPGRLPAALHKAEQSGIDLVFIDTPARSEQAALAAASLATLVIIPTRPQAYDLETIPNTQKLLALADKKPAIVVLNAVPALGNRHEQARELLGQMGMEVCPATIGHRAAFGDSGALGQTPEEYDPDGKAAEEIRNVYKYICRKIGKR
jgi:chromosome partitioning protein